MNKATYFGGAIYLFCIENDCRSSIANSEFTENIAEDFAGGGIFWLYIKPNDINNTFSDNEASIGPDHASLGYGVQRIEGR